jgi:flagellar assembly factor FliW
MSERITETKEIHSSYFGELEIIPEHIFYFENGILGFEMLNNFVLITDDDIAPFKWLMSIEEPEIMFPIISPFYIDSVYDPGKGIDTEKQILFSIVTLNDGNGNITANLKAPVVLNPIDNTGEQIILSFEKYSVSQIISQKN